MKRLLIGATGLTAVATLTFCGPPHADVGAAKCAVNPATGHVFANVVDVGRCGPGPVIAVDVDCGPLTIATTEDDGCVRAQIVGDGTSTGVRGAVIVPRWYVNPAAGDVAYGTVE